MFSNRSYKIHFVGIGGIGMSAIAEILVNLGYDVRGSDIRSSGVTRRLEEQGAKIFIGHEQKNIGNAEVVVFSTAINAQNPEIQNARSRHIPCIPRAEMLAELMRMKYAIAVAGTHGKTTTTSFLSTILLSGGIDPTVIIGGRLKSINSNARLGMGKYLVAEADESDGSFLKLFPTIAIVTSIDAEHLDHWAGGLPEIQEGFKSFVNKIPFYGLAVLCIDHPVVKKLSESVQYRVLTYGLSPLAMLRAENIKVSDQGTTFSVILHKKNLGQFHLNLPGNHNIQNALAAIAVAQEVGVDISVIRDSLGSFEGVARRFDVKGIVNDIMVC